MRAELTADQILLAKTARRLATDLGVPEPNGLPSTDAAGRGWGLAARTGLLGMQLDPDDGGGGANCVDVALVVEAFAATTSLVPILGQGVLAPELARLAGADRSVLAGMADGSIRAAIALGADLGTTDAWKDGAIAFDARGATHVIGLDGDRRVRLSAAGGDVVDQADLTRILRRAGTDVDTGDVVGGPLDDHALRRFEAFALSMVTADLVGVMESALAAAVEYVRSRAQFGVPVGTFQAVQHLAADAEVALQASRSSMWHAAWAVGELEPGEALLAARQAKAFVSRAALDVVEIHTQLLGGIAITWEEQAHLRVRRVLLDRVVFGDEAVHEDAIAAARLGPI